MSQKRQRGIRATSEGKGLLLTAKGSCRGQAWTNESIASELQYSTRTVARFFRGEKIDKPHAYAIVKFLELQPEDILLLEEVLVDRSIQVVRDAEAAGSTQAKELIDTLALALDELQREEEISLPAMEWLKANRNFIAKEAAEFVLMENADQGSSIASELEIDKFSDEIRKYLQVLYYCLEEGSWEVIDGAIQESLLPDSREVVFYTKALVFIKDRKMKQSLPSESAQVMELCLEYLINVLPLRL